MSLDGISKPKQASLFQALLEDIEASKKEQLARQDSAAPDDPTQIGPSPFYRKRTKEGRTQNGERRNKHSRSCHVDRLQ